MATTNWKRWFGSPRAASESVSRLVDYFDARARGEEFSSPFTDNFQLEGACEYGLIHQGTLTSWLEEPCEDTSSEQVSEASKERERLEGSSGFEPSELEKLVSALRGKCAYAVSLDKENKPKAVSIKLEKGQMNVYEGACEGALSVTIDHMTAVPVEYVLGMLGIKVNE